MTAPAALQAIALWVKNFFGCAECAAHFTEYYRRNGGDSVGDGQIGAVIWLWTAHNDVSMRLRGEELANDGKSLKAVWPSAEQCDTCFNASAREESRRPTWGAHADMSAGDWQPHTVFEYHQEVYCFESDTYVCSGFDDPSKETALRSKREESK